MNTDTNNDNHNNYRDDEANDHANKFLGESHDNVLILIWFRFINNC